MVVTRGVQQTPKYTLLMVPRGSWEPTEGAGRIRGATRGRTTTTTITSGALRTQSLDRGAAARMVAAATATRAVGVLERRGSHDGGAAGKTDRFFGDNTEDIQHNDDYIVGKDDILTLHYISNIFKTGLSQNIQSF